jgi:hypothetical protein
MLPRVATILTGLTLAAPAGASAQDGVFVDPDSPSGKEYAIPLESARRQADPAAGGGRIAPGRRDESPLFGEGVDEPIAGARGTGKDASRGSGKPRPGRAKEESDGGGPPAPATVRAAASRPGAPDGGLGSTLTIVGGGILVLLIGGGAGLLLRRSQPGAPA